jgi:hypothetical protein
MVTVTLPLCLLSACARTTSVQQGSATAPAAAAQSWPLPAGASAAAAKAGLPMLGQEMLAVHYHAHLDVQVDGVPITVPAGIGIDVARQKISPLHTHDTSGVIHIESARDIPYTLGQLFTEWGQPLTTHQVGTHRLTKDEALRVYQNGHLVTGDPATLRFAEREEIVVWVGPASANPQATTPSSYAFPQGL